MTILTPISTGNKTTKVKRLREDGFCIFFVFLLFGFYFVVGPLFYAFVKFRKKIITKILVITYKSSILDSFYYKEKFCHKLGFYLVFCHNPRKIVKEEE